MEVDGDAFMLEIMDTAGQEEYVKQSKLQTTLIVSEIILSGIQKLISFFHVISIYLSIYLLDTLHSEMIIWEEQTDCL